MTSSADTACDTTITDLVLNTWLPSVSPQVAAPAVTSSNGILPNVTSHYFLLFLAASTPLQGGEAGAARNGSDMVLPIGE